MRCTCPATSPFRHAERAPSAFVQSLIEAAERSRRLSTTQSQSTAGQRAAGIDVTPRVRGKNHPKKGAPV